MEGTLSPADPFSPPPSTFRGYSPLTNSSCQTVRIDHCGFPSSAQSWLSHCFTRAAPTRLVSFLSLLPRETIKRAQPRAHRCSEAIRLPTGTSEAYQIGHETAYHQSIQPLQERPRPGCRLDEPTWCPLRLRHLTGNPSSIEQAMSDFTNYHSVAAKEGAVATTTTKQGGAAAAAAHPGLWTRITNHLPFLRTKRGIAVTVVAILVIIGGGLAGLAALHDRNSGADGDGSGADGDGDGLSPDAITSDTHFYGRSPPVYPSRESGLCLLAARVLCMHYCLWGEEGVLPCYSLRLTLCRAANITGTGTWASSLQRAQAMVANMTLDEKVRPGRLVSSPSEVGTAKWTRFC